MQKKKWLLALLAAAVLVLAICGCQSDEQQPVEAQTTTDIVTTEAPAPATIDLVVGGEAKYVIVRPELATQTEIDTAVAIRAAIESATGTAPTLTTDWIKRGQEYDSSTYEILVGATGHAETAQVREELHYGDYTITPSGNKLVITAWGDNGIAKAGDVFKLAIGEYGTDGSLSLPADYQASGTSNSMVNLLPLYAGGSMSGIIDCADDNYMIYITGTTAEEYSAYCKLLEAAGYSLYTTHEAVDNQFATYTNAEYTVTAYYTGCDKEARVIIEPHPGCRRAPRTPAMPMTSTNPPCG